MLPGTPSMPQKALKLKKNDVLGGFLVENSSPSTIWGVGCCQNFYFLKQQQKLLTFCKIVFLSLTHKKLRSSTKKLPESGLVDFLASFDIFLIYSRYIINIYQIYRYLIFYHVKWHVKIYQIIQYFTDISWYIDIISLIYQVLIYFDISKW